METLAVKLEELVADRRARIVGGVLAAVVLAVSLGLVAASRSPRHFKALSTHLPEHTLQIPMVKSLAQPLPKASAGALAAARARQTGVRETLTANR